MAAQAEGEAGAVSTHVVRSTETRWSNAANLLRLAPLTAVQAHIASVQVLLPLAATVHSEHWRMSISERQMLSPF